jgi:hypothetical protein
MFKFLPWAYSLLSIPLLHKDQIIVPETVFIEKEVTFILLTFIDNANGCN